MLPKIHFLLGAIFSLLIYISFQITPFQAFLIFFASVFIDFDHYLWFVNKKKDQSLKNAYTFLKKLRVKRFKPIMMIFHTIEFHLIIILLALIYKPFLFIFIGMSFHSILDIISLNYEEELNFREFSFIRYLIRDKKNYF